MYVNPVLIVKENGMYPHKPQNLNLSSMAQSLCRKKIQTSSRFVSNLHITLYTRILQRTCYRKTGVQHTQATVQAYVDAPTPVPDCGYLSLKFVRKVTTALTRVRDSPFTQLTFIGGEDRRSTRQLRGF